MPEQENQSKIETFYMPGMLRHGVHVIFTPDAMTSSRLVPFARKNSKAIKQYANQIHVPSGEQLINGPASTCPYDASHPETAFSGLDRKDQVAIITASADDADLMVRNAHESNVFRVKVYGITPNAFELIRFADLPEGKGYGKPKQAHADKPNHDHKPQESHNNKSNAQRKAAVADALAPDAFSAFAAIVPYDPTPHYAANAVILPDVPFTPSFQQIDFYGRTTGRVYHVAGVEMNCTGGVMYSTDQQYLWIKLYSREYLTSYMEQKISLMLTRNLQHEGICWPLEIIQDEHGNFRGYATIVGGGEPLLTSVFKRASMKTMFPDWTRRDLMRLIVTIMDKFEYLHSHAVLAGCINPASIRVVSPEKVFFVDLDAYQIEGFPALSFNLSFTPPEKIDSPMYFANLENEKFELAELVFMIAMPGKMPYALQSDSSPSEAIKNMRFPYAGEGTRSAKNLPSVWRFVWSHLGKIKRPLFETLTVGGAHNPVGKRYNASQWKKFAQSEYDALAHPIDPESLKIYPATFLRMQGDEFVQCKYCGQMHPRFFFDDRYFDKYQICNSCLDKKSDVGFTCQICHKKYYYSNRTALYHQMKMAADPSWRKQKYCSDCKKKTIICSRCGKEKLLVKSRSGVCFDCRDEVVETRTCRVCGNQFGITYGEELELQRKGYSLPTRCQECRKNNRKSADDLPSQHTDSFNDIPVFTESNTAQSVVDYEEPQAVDEKIARSFAEATGSNQPKKHHFWPFGRKGE